jgi:hypothetical protein
LCFPTSPTLPLRIEKQAIDDRQYAILIVNVEVRQKTIGQRSHNYRKDCHLHMVGIKKRRRWLIDTCKASDTLRPTEHGLGLGSGSANACSADGPCRRLLTGPANALAKKRNGGHVQTRSKAFYQHHPRFGLRTVLRYEWLFGVRPAEVDDVPLALRMVPSLGFSETCNPAQE